jgi:hypothetical protein
MAGPSPEAKQFLTGDQAPPEEDGAKQAGDGEPGVRRAAVESAARGEELTGQEEADATAWYLDSELDEYGDFSLFDFTLNIAPKGKPARHVPWQIRSMDRDRIKQIRKLNTHDGVEDDMAVNLALSTEATTKPDLRSAEVRGKYADPADALRLRLFRHKQGLIDQIANQVMEVSGYDTEDVVEVEAAGN